MLQLTRARTPQLVTLAVLKPIKQNCKYRRLLNKSSSHFLRASYSTYYQPERPQHTTHQQTQPRPPHMHICLDAQRCTLYYVLGTTIATNTTAHARGKTLHRLSDVTVVVDHRDEIGRRCDLIELIDATAEEVVGLADCVGECHGEPGIEGEDAFLRDSESGRCARVG